MSVSPCPQVWQCRRVVARASHITIQIGRGSDTIETFYQVPPRTFDSSRFSISREQQLIDKYSGALISYAPKFAFSGARADLMCLRFKINPSTLENKQIALAQSKNR